MEIQGDGSRIDQVIRSIRDGRYIEISSMEVEQIQVKEERAQIPCR